MPTFFGLAFAGDFPVAVMSLRAVRTLLRRHVEVESEPLHLVLISPQSSLRGLISLKDMTPFNTQSAFVSRLNSAGNLSKGVAGQVLCSTAAGHVIDGKGELPGPRSVGKQLAFGAASSLLPSLAAATGGGAGYVTPTATPTHGASAAVDIPRSGRGKPWPSGNEVPCSPPALGAEMQSWTQREEFAAPPLSPAAVVRAEALGASDGFNFHEAGGYRALVTALNRAGLYQVQPDHWQPSAVGNVSFRSSIGHCFGVAAAQRLIRDYWPWDSAEKYRERTSLLPEVTLGKGLSHLLHRPDEGAPFKSFKVCVKKVRANYYPLGAMAGTPAARAAVSEFEGDVSALAAARAF